MTEQRYSVKLALKSPGLDRRFSQIILASGGFVISPGHTGGVDLAIMELADDPESAMRELQALLDSGATDDVFLTSAAAHPSVLMQAMRMGVKEFFAQPIDLEEVKRAFDRFKERKQAVSGRVEKTGQAITVFGSKGGVGTTTVAVNLAVSLAQGTPSNSVALLDMNTLFGEIPLFLEMAPKFHWGEITKNIDRLDGAFLQNVLTRHQSGIQVLPSPAYLNGHIRPTPDTMVRLLGLMKRMFDFVIIDAGQSTEDTSLKVMEITDSLLLVTILSLPCLANTNKLLRSLTDLGYVSKERIRVVLNRYMKKGDISLEDAEAGIGKDLFWVIPNDYATTMSAINNGKPLVYVSPKAPITKSFIDLAASMASPGDDKPKKKWSIL
jgi:pilus assembly protein CpaE